MTDSPADTTPTTSRLLLPAIAAGIMLAPLNSTMIAIALPDIQRGFDTSVSTTAWLVTIYLIVMAVGLPVGGRLGDLYGRRRMYVIGLVWFAVASVGCALAPSFAWLVVFRVQQALAGTLVFPTGAALVHEAIPAGRRGMAYAMVGLGASAAAASGPPIGGVLVESFGWPAIFWVNLPFIAVVLPMAWLGLPRRAGTGRGRERFDVVGLALLAGALAALMTIPTLLTRGHGALALAGLLAACVAAWAFQRWERRVRSPIVDPALFASPHFAAACAAVLLGNLVMYTTLLAIPLYLAGVGGEGAGTTGLVLGAMSVMAAVATPIGGRWADRQGRWLPAVAGGAAVCAGAMLLVLAGIAGSTPLLVAALGVLGVGLGIAGAPLQAAAVESVPAARAGAASGVYSTSRYVGSVIGSIGLALLFARAPDPGDGERFVALFAVLAVVAMVGMLANARVADRDVSAVEAGTLGAQRR